MYRGKKFYDSAQRYNKRHPNGIIKYLSDNPSNSKEFAKDVSDLQKTLDLDIDGKLGPITLSRVRQDHFDTTPSMKLTDKDLFKIARIISKFEGKYWSCNKDGEFRGLFDRDTKKHWASGKTHIGLSFGYIQFTQDSGNLGKLLKMMLDADPCKFKEIFGTHSDELIKTTNKPGRTRKEGRSPRVQPVGGHDLWTSYWTKRFVSAGKHKAFQDCQIQFSISEFMIPAIKTANKLNIKSERGLAVVFDRSVQYGPAGAKRLISKVRGEEPEHLFLKTLTTLWKKYRWHHRFMKIYYETALRDSSFD